MDTQLTHAAEAYRAAAAVEAAAARDLAAARRQKALALADVEAAREPLAEAIISAAMAGVRQRDILAAIGGAYTRERVRQICRAAGIDRDTRSNHHPSSPNGDGGVHWVRPRIRRTRSTSTQQVNDDPSLTVQDPRKAWEQRESRP